MKTNKRIQSEIKTVNKKQFAVMDKIAVSIGGGVILSVVASFVLFVIGTAFYCFDNSFYRVIDKFSANLVDGIFTVVMVLCAFFGLRLYGYIKQEQSLKSVLNKKRVRR